MPRRVTLVALWLVFAVASVSVGFAAANLVSDPFTDVGNAAEAADDTPFTAAPATSTPQPSGSSSPSGPSASTGGTSTAAPAKTPGTVAASSTVKRGISTRGGYVSASCRGGLVSVGAAPAVYWRVDSLTSGRVHSARVRLEPVQDANGERVEVTATCTGGIPAFTTEYNEGSGGGGGEDDGNSGKGSDDSGSSGSDDSGSSGSSGSGSSGSGGG